MKLRAGDRFDLVASSDAPPGDETQVGVSYLGLPNDVRPGDILLLDDGLMQLQVVSVDGERAALEAIQRGELGATVESNPRFGPIAFETVEKVRRGEAVPTKQLITDRFFDKRNAAQFVGEAY